ncbi:hypothetical protein [Pseudomonas sp. URMO17WK12:I11]|uniref:hypothetical protein n=1 Tax=Pseudomonas sp. URMO17WK12:I11 TaxID=1283291 RepID=UPI0018D9E6EF|nr:hypothetical protein [Pseudomonas sp. URMO17WK12:I11]MBH3361537.1 hypothetical protein [Pseudomonas sp. URMO17WK12:I11]
MPRQSDLRYSFQPLVGDAEFEVVSFTLKKGISQPFTLELQLISYEHDIDLSPVVSLVTDSSSTCGCLPS